MPHRPNIWLPCALALAVGAGYFFLHRTATPSQHQSAPTSPDSAAALTPPSKRTPVSNAQPAANAPLLPHVVDDDGDHDQDAGDDQRELQRAHILEFIT